MFELDNAFLNTTTTGTTMLLTSCLTPIPVVCLQYEDQQALVRPPPGLPLPSSDDKDEAYDKFCSLYWVGCKRAAQCQVLTCKIDMGCVRFSSLGWL